MKNRKDTKTVVGYVRSDTENDKSVKEQEDRIREYCKKNGYKLSEVLIDNGYSGLTLDRPAIKKLFVEIPKRNTSMVITTDSSRLSRMINEYLFLKTSFIKYGTRIVFVSKEPANDDPYIRYVDEILATVNALQPRIASYRRISSKSQMKHFSVDKQNRFKRLVKIVVSEKDLNNTSKFKEMLKDECFYGCTCGLSRSQIVLIAKILRLNLENDTEVKAEFRF